MKINKELMKGSSQLLVLKVISDGPLYGYEIAKKIKQQSSELFTMGEGTLYPVLHKIEQLGLVDAYWQEVDGRRRKYYELTHKGRKTLEEKTTEWQNFSQAVNTIITA